MKEGKKEGRKKEREKEGGREEEKRTRGLEAGIPYFLNITFLSK